ncbi:MAG: aminotransferase class V-fold PLP-dependent enzyme [Anaerovorax sp.]
MIYLDNGATTFPKPAIMVKEMCRCMSEYCGNPGRAGHKMAMKTGEEIYKTRRAIGELFQIPDAGRIVFTLNTTEAINLGLKGFLKWGDHVITTSMEHNSVLRPLVALKQRGVQYTIIRCCKDGSLPLETLRKSIRPNTKLIVCTHASNVTGTIMPIYEVGKIAKCCNIPFFVDCAQSAGTLHINVEKMNISMLAFPGHKGLLGPLGTGGLYVKEGIALVPLKEGGTGTASRELEQPYDFPEGYESGTVNAPGIIGLGYSLQYLRSLGIENIRKFEEGLTEKLTESLRNMRRISLYGPLDSRKKTGVVLFNVGNRNCEEVASILSETYDIASRAGFHCAGLAHKTIGTGEVGGVRLSVGPFNTKKEIEKTIDSIYKITKMPT